MRRFFDQDVLACIKAELKRRPYDLEVITDWYSWCVEMDDHSENKKLREYLAKGISHPREEWDEDMLTDIYEAWKESLRWDAYVDFDCYCIFLELNRENKFYAPRRKQLLPIVKQLQRLADDELDLLCISCPPGIGKTAIATFFETWLAGREPDKAMLTGSHNASFLEGLYSETLRILDPNGEYLWGQVFRGKGVCRTNAKSMTIDVHKAKKFCTFQYASLGSGMAGKVRAQQLLYCDDLVSGIEVALSKERLDKLWDSYTIDYRQRMQGSCKQLVIATRWSVYDHIGRLQEMYGESDRAYFLTMAALNEQGESNFDYGGDIGFTTEFYEDMKANMDEVSWRALYMNEPIEREGLLYNNDELNRYYELPSDKPDMILAVCDTAEGGGDDTVMPIFAVFGNDHYLIDCVCSNALPEVTDGLCADALVRNNVKACQFESNSAGGRTADKVEELVKAKAQGRPTHITKKRTTANKETKIIVESSWVKEHCYFLDEKKITKGSTYAQFMRKMCSYSVSGKNKHDDVVDALAQYSLFTENLGGGQATIVRRMF